MSSNDGSRTPQQDFHNPLAANSDPETVTTVDSSGNVSVAQARLTGTAGDIYRDAREGALRTVRTQTGSIPATIEPDHLVTVSGMEVTVAQALAMKLLARNDRGEVFDPHYVPQQGGAQEPASSPSGMPTDEEAADTIRAMVAGLPEPLVQSMLLAKLRGGEPDQSLVAAFGLDAAKVSEQVRKVEGAMSVMLTDALVQRGLSREEVGEFLTFAYDRDRIAYASAGVQLFHTGRADAFMRHLPEWQRTRRKDAEQVQAHARRANAWHGVQGDVVTINGVTMERARAVRMGLIGG